MLTSQAREMLRTRRDGDRRRDPRGGRHQARRPPGAVAGAAGARWPAHPCSGSGCRPPSGRWRRSARFLGGSTARSTIVDAGAAQAARPRGGGAGRGHARAGRRARSVDGEPRQVDLAGRLPAPAGAGAGPRSTIVFVNSRRSAERLAQPAERAGRGRDRPRAHHGSIAREQRLEVEDDAQGAASCRRWWPPRSLELGIDMGAVDLVVQVESPRRWRAACSASAVPGTRSAQASRGRFFPKYRGDLLETRGGGAAHARGRRSSTRACRASRWTCWPSRSWRWRPWTTWPVADLHALVRRAVSLQRALGAAVRGRAGHAGRALPVRRVRRAAAAHHLGPRPATASARRDGARRLAVIVRRHHPRPRPLRRVPGRLGRAGRRAGRGDGVRGRAQGEVFLLGATSWRIERDHPRPGARLARRRASPARCRSGRATAGSAVELGLGDRARSARLARTRARATGCAATLDERAARNLSPTWTTSARPPARCPTTARS